MASKVIKRTCGRIGEPEAFTVLDSHGIEPTADGVIYWHIVNLTPDMEKLKIIRSIEEAYKRWQSAFDLINPQGQVIQFMPTSDINQAHTLHMFINPRQRGRQVLQRVDGGTYEVNIRFPFDGNGGVLAYVVNGEPHVYYDEGENWGEMYKWQNDELHCSLLNVAIHEIGHTLDIGHSTDRDSIMYPTADGREELGQDDFDAIDHIWGGTKRSLAGSLEKQTFEDRLGLRLLGHAMRYYGIKEVQGEQSNELILEWIRNYAPYAIDDEEVAWCSIFLCSIAQDLGVEHPNSPTARSWLNVGEEIPWGQHDTGDIIVFWRESLDSWKGHVGIIVNSVGTPAGTVLVLGGNQNNMVNIRRYDLSRLLGVRRLKPQHNGDNT